MNSQHMLLRYNACPPSAQNSPLLAFVILVEASVPTVSVKVQMITPPFHHLVWLSGSSQCSLCFSPISLNAVSWVWRSCSFQYSPIFFPFVALEERFVQLHANSSSLTCVPVSWAFAFYFFHIPFQDLTYSVPIFFT